MANSETEFYCVLASDDMRLVRHDTQGQALTEAKRLAGANTTKKFFVLKAVKCAKTQQPVVVEDTVDEIPF